VNDRTETAVPELTELNDAPDVSLSDHAPLTVDVPLREPPLKTGGS
jgi:hypothetical protein